MDLRLSFNKYKKSKILKIKRKMQESMIKKEIEKDYELEIEGNAADYLKTGTASSGPKFSNGKLVPYSIIGPTKLFLSKNDDKSSNRYRRLTTTSGYSKFGSRSSIPLQVSGNLNKFGEVIRRLKEIREKEKQTQKNEEKLREIIDEDDSDNFPETSSKDRKNNKISVNFSEKKVNLHPIEPIGSSNISVNSRKSESRHKKNVKTQDMGDLYWYMSLREDKNAEKIDTYMRIGNELSGLYTKVRKPNPSYDFSSSKITSFRSLNKKLEIIGNSKLELELEAIQKVGIESLRLDFLDSTKYPDEVILENYDCVETPRKAKKSNYF